MLQPVTPMISESMPILYFLFNGSPVFQDIDSSGHIWYDICNCYACQEDYWDDDDLSPKRKSSQRKLQQRYENGDPTVSLLGEPSGKFDFYVIYGDKPLSQPSPKSKTPTPCKPNKPLPRLLPYYEKALKYLNPKRPSNL